MRFMILFVALTVGCVAEVIEGADDLPPGTTDFRGTSTLTYSFSDGDFLVTGPEPVDETVMVILNEETDELVIETAWCSIVARQRSRREEGLEAMVDPARTVCHLPAAEGQIALTIGTNSWVYWTYDTLEIRVVGEATWNGATSRWVHEFDGEYI